MVCESWKAQLDTYLDGELSAEEMRSFDAHVRGCTTCSADALARLQMKRAIHAAGKRFSPSAEFRTRVQRSITPKPHRSFNLNWVLATAMLAVLAVGMATAGFVGIRAARERAFSEIADLHVETLASSSPVDVVSTDRHTVKPWFQGKIPFSFNLPEIQSTEFTLLGGRVTYLEQTPGAHLIYDVRKHHISVFIFPDEAMRGHLGQQSFSPKEMPFNMETWAQSGLRYFVIGDASSADIDKLAGLFKAN